MAMTNTEEYRQEEAASEHARLEAIAAKYGCAVSNAVPEYCGECTELLVTPIDDSYEFPYEEIGFEGALIRQQLETIVGRIVEQCPKEIAHRTALILSEYTVKLGRKAVDDADV